MPPTTDPETEFDRALQAFGTDADIAIQCFYVWLTVHDAARKNLKLYHLFGRDRFWTLANGSIQANSLIALGRIFDEDPRSHSVKHLLELAEQNISIFSKDALRKRKGKLSPNADEWIDDFMRNVFVPKVSDFKRWQSFVKARRTVYESCYKQLRNKVYAHRDRTDPMGIVAKTNIRELGRLVSDMYQLHSVLLELLQDGRKPRLRPLRHSAGHRIERDTRKFLKSLIAKSAAVGKRRARKSASRPRRTGVRSEPMEEGHDASGSRFTQSSRHRSARV
jgi:hypothetical protein